MIGNATAVVTSGDGAKRQLRQGEVDVKFYVMPGLADPIIMGYPDTSRCGMFAEPPDHEDRSWVQFFSMDGLRLPVIKPTSGGAKIQATKSVTIEGPDMRPIEVSITDREYQDAVL